MLFAAGFSSKTASGRKVNLKLKENKVGNKAARDKSLEIFEIDFTDSLLCDTLFRRIVVTGYDKPATSLKESFFVTNNTGRKIVAVKFSIRYLTIDGRELDNVVREVKKSISPGQTSRIDLQAWDTQRSFHYCKSRSSQKRATMPYDVRIIPVAVTLYKQKF